MNKNELIKNFELAEKMEEYMAVLKMPSMVKRQVQMQIGNESYPSAVSAFKRYSLMRGVEVPAFITEVLDRSKRNSDEHKEEVVALLLGMN